MAQRGQDIDICIHSGAQALHHQSEADRQVARAEQNHPAGRIVRLHGGSARIQ
jgi:hypothetical protein